MQEALQRLASIPGPRWWSLLDIRAGQEYEHELAENIARADIIVLLVTPELIASSADLIELAWARVARGGATLVPVLVRPSTWRTHPRLGKLKPCPSSGEPILGGGGSVDAAWVKVHGELQALLHPAPPPPRPSPPLLHPLPPPPEPASPEVLFGAELTRGPARWWLVPALALVAATASGGAAWHLLRVARPASSHPPTSCLCGDEADACLQAKSSPSERLQCIAEKHIKGLCQSAPNSLFCMEYLLDGPQKKEACKRLAQQAQEGKNLVAQYLVKIRCAGGPPDATAVGPPLVTDLEDLCKKGISSACAQLAEPFFARHAQAAAKEPNVASASKVNKQELEKLASKAAKYVYDACYKASEACLGSRECRFAAGAACHRVATIRLNGATTLEPSAAQCAAAVEDLLVGCTLQDHESCCGAASLRGIPISGCDRTFSWEATPLGGGAPLKKTLRFAYCKSAPVGPGAAPL